MTARPSTASPGLVPGDAPLPRLARLALRLAGADWVLRRRAAALMAQAGADAWLHAGGRYLEIGAGLGHLTDWAARRQPGSRWIALEPVWRPLGAVRDRLAGEAPGRVDFVRGDGRALGFRAERFDGVLLAFVLHHLDPQDQLAVLGEAHRVLKRGGTLVLLEDVPETPAQWRMTELSDRLLNAERAGTPHHYRSRAAWRRCLGDIGFRLVWERPFGRTFPEPLPVPHAAMLCHRIVGEGPSYEAGARPPEAGAPTKRLRYAGRAGSC